MAQFIHLHAEMHQKNYRPFQLLGIQKNESCPHMSFKHVKMFVHNLVCELCVKLLLPCQVVGDGIKESDKIGPSPIILDECDNATLDLMPLLMTITLPADEQLHHCCGQCLGKQKSH